ncbi:MAG: YhcH/YjgK/YiaL family protein [Clostridiaceae bacterium]
MIYDNLKNIGKYHFENENMKKAIEFLTSNDLLSMEPKRYEIVKDEVYINLLDINQKPLAEREYEAHNLFTDIHIPIEGLDFIRSTETTNLTVTTPYTVNGDFLFGTYEGDAYTDSSIPKGYFGLYFPEDAHLVNGTPNEPGKVKKYVVKIKVK